MRARGPMGRDEGKIATGRFRSQVIFLKVTALFWYFFCSASFVTFIYLLVTIKEVFWRFSRFAGMACAREAKDSRESTDDLDGSFYSELWIEGW